MALVNYLNILINIIPGFYLMGNLETDMGEEIL